MLKRLWRVSLLPLACFAFFSLLSVWPGQGANWDARNYHVYNPYALLNSRIGVYLAPAQLQTYFNPLLDVPVHFLNSHLSARAVGLQGLNAALFVAVGRLCLESPA